MNEVAFWYAVGLVAGLFFGYTLGIGWLRKPVDAPLNEEDAAEDNWVRVDTQVAADARPDLNPHEAVIAYARAHYVPRKSQKTR